VRILALALLLLLAPAAGAAERVASFGIILDNTSMEPTRPDELERLARAERQLAEALAERGYVLVDIAPVRAAAERQDLRSCPACEVALARELGADLAVLGWVQKVSNLILNINLAVHEVATGRLVRAGSVDIRGNTDESWSRGLRILIDRQVFPRS
jgi:hypothetical protein